MFVNPFNPSPGTNQLITTSGVSQPLTLRSVDKCVRIVNYGANAAHVAIGVGAQTASATSLVVRSASTEIFYKGEGADGIAVLQITGATSLAISTGQDGI